MAKKVQMMILKSCPYCIMAFEMMETLKKQNEKYGQVEVEVIQEDVFPEIANALDYYYVPTYFVDGKKIHEGVPTIDKVDAVFKEALRD